MYLNYIITAQVNVYQIGELLNMAHLLSYIFDPESDIVLLQCVVGLITVEC